MLSRLRKFYEALTSSIFVEKYPQCKKNRIMEMLFIKTKWNLPCQCLFLPNNDDQNHAYNYMHFHLLTQCDGGGKHNKLSEICLNKRMLGESVIQL